MTIDNITITLKRDIIRAFAVLDAWFDKDEGFYHYKPPSEHGHAFDIMRYVVLTNDHLLVLINSGCKEALRHAKLNNDNWTIDDYTLHSMSLEDSVVHQFFNELHHKFNSSDEKRTAESIREELRDQLYRCLCQLELLRNGEGSLHGTRLSENSSAKIDIYQLMNLLSLNIWKQITLLKKIEAMYDQQIALN